MVNKSTTQGDTSKISSDEKSQYDYDTVEIPVAETYPVATSERWLVNSRALDALFESNPGVALDLIREHQDQQRKKQEQSFELEKIKIDYEHQIGIKKEENRLKNSQQDRNLICIGITAFCTIFIAALVYAARVNDKNLPNTVITAAISLLAGGSTSVLAVSKSKSNKEENSQSN